VTEVPASPRATRLVAPGWLDARFVTGVLLVLVSVVVGAAVVDGAADTVGVYAVTRDVAAGEVLEPGDVAVVQVALPDTQRYVLSGGRPPDGQVLGRPVGEGELLAVAALLAPDAIDPRRLVTLPVDRLHVPPALRAGDLVDVYATQGAPDAPTSTQVVLQRVRVVSADDDERALAGGSGLRGVVVEVAPADTGRLVFALQGGRLDLVVAVGGQRPGDVGDAPVTSATDRADAPEGQPAPRVDGQPEP
jgi:hypothetical protein